MESPVIAITRHKSGFYEWAIVYRNELVDSDVGYSSISTCLSSAADGIPDDAKMVEVRYRTVGMGTFPLVALIEAPEVIADSIADLYGELLNKT